MREYRIQMLSDTLDICDKGYYYFGNRKVDLKLTKEEMTAATVYLPEDIKALDARKGTNHSLKPGSEVKVSCVNADSYSVARDISGGARVLVLNLANAVHPGGGVRRGAKAQEEDLCRKSSLLLSLESKAAKSYYEYNFQLHSYLGSDAIVIHPNVEIIKDTDGGLLENTVVAAAMTCAAPNLRYGFEGMTEEAYQAMVLQRIAGMLQLAAWSGYEKLVLGAFGCGAFHNDAKVISDLFYRAMKDFRYNGIYQLKDCFSTIVFAVMDGTPDQYNFNEFSRNFNKTGDGSASCLDAKRKTLLPSTAGPTWRPL